MNAVTRLLINTKNRIVYRSSITGRFVKAVYAKLNPWTTTKEQNK